MYYKKLDEYFKSKGIRKNQVEKLQLLLGHKTITQTMIYAHIVQADANSEIFLLDDLF